MRFMMICLLLLTSAMAQERLFDVYTLTDTLRAIEVEQFNQKDGILYFQKDGQHSFISTSIIFMIKDSRLGTTMWVNPEPPKAVKINPANLQDKNIQASIELKQSAKRYLDLIFIFAILSTIASFILITT